MQKVKFYRKFRFQEERKNNTTSYFSCLNLLKGLCLRLKQMLRKSWKLSPAIETC